MLASARLGSARLGSAVTQGNGAILPAHEYSADPHREGLKTYRRAQAPALTLRALNCQPTIGTCESESAVAPGLPSARPALARLSLPVTDGPIGPQRQRAWFRTAAGESAGNVRRQSGPENAAAARHSMRRLSDQPWVLGASARYSGYSATGLQQGGGVHGGSTPATAPHTYLTTVLE